MNDSSAKPSHDRFIRQPRPAGGGLQKSPAGGGLQKSPAGGGLPTSLAERGHLTNPAVREFGSTRRLTVLAQVVALAAMFNALIGGGVPFAAASAPIRIVAFGDSLTAGYGVQPSQSFPAQLSAALKAKGVAAEIVNAGVSGDTSGAGLARLDWAIPDGTDAVILELGANDALRGIDPALTRKALGDIVARLKARNIDILIAGMKAPANWGADYAAKFDAIFPDLASANGLILYPFFLDGVAMQQGLNQPDGLHPTAKGVAEIVKRMLPSVEQLIARTERRRATPAKT